MKNASAEAIGEILHERIYYRKNLRLDKNRKIQVRARRPGNLRTIKGLAMSHMANPDVVRNCRFYIHLYHILYVYYMYILYIIYIFICYTYICM